MGTTLRDTIEESVNKVEAEEVVNDATPVEAPVVAPIDKVDAATIAESERVAEANKPGRTAGRQRDENGRLLPGKAEAKGTPVAPQAQEGAVQAEVKPLPRPSSWEKGMWPIWDKLNTGAPLDAKEARQLAEYTGKREGDYAKGVSTYKQEWESAKPLLDAVAPFLPVLQQHNIQPGQWISNLGRAHHTLATGDNNSKLQAFSKLAQEYGVPLQALYDPAFAQQFVTQQVQRQAPQPNVDELVERKFAQYRTQDSIAQFAAAKDATGNPAHPHFEAVRQQMGRLLDAGLAQDLNDAYSKALKLDEGLWQAEQDAKKNADEATRLEAQRKATAAAKANAVSPRSATPSSAGAGANKGLRSTIAEAVDQHTSSRV